MNHIKEKWLRQGEYTGEWKGGRRVKGLRSDGVHEVSLNRILGIRKY